MISTRDIDDIIGAEAHDQDDAKIGKVEQIYIDQETEQPVWVSVRSGLFGRSETLVPLTGATWDRTALRLAVPKDRVKDAPRVEPGAEVTPEEQERLYDYYAQADRGDLDRDDRGGRVAHAADLGSDRDRLGQDDGRADASRVVDDPVASDRDRYTAAGGERAPSTWTAPTTTAATTATAVSTAARTGPSAVSTTRRTARWCAPRSRCTSGPSAWPRAARGSSGTR